MADGEDWLLRPVEAGYYSLVDLKTGAVDLLDIAIANDAMDVKAENQRRWQANKQ